MHLTRLYVRFFRSFNYDYERKARGNATPATWELIDGVWYPFIRVPLDTAVTAVVGANESGKSHLLDAIEQALTGDGIHRRDFCRYSQLFSVETGESRVPDLGVEVELDDADDVSCIIALSPGIGAAPGDRVALLRLGDTGDVLLDQRGVAHELTTADVQQLEVRLPAPFTLLTDVALPDSVSLDALVQRTPGPFTDRQRRSEFIELVGGLGDVTADTLTAAIAPMVELLGRPVETPSTDRALPLTPEALALALLSKVARIDRTAFEDLEAALRDGHEGRVGGLIAKMNAALARHLNFSRWWRQDRDFQLQVAPRERELVFIIRDRTGTDYSFGERSKGLRYFLSYYVQLRVHVHARLDDRPEVLLMDEPDAYLSSVGQQDLLRTLESFARPDDGRRSDQVLYVTHSPFLIDKNAAHRIRVLDKGSNEEGTRVVKDVARNHYEPLRSAVGSFVAETAFIGGTNLLVEGPADQVLLAGTSALLRRRDVSPGDLLDLNDVTIVPAGSAEAIPYMTYLARGRDELKPACVALFDGDAAGKGAIKKLRRSVVGGKQILHPDHIVNLKEWAADTDDLTVASGVTVTETEDLIPLPIAAEAARRYAEHLMGRSSEETKALSVQLLIDALDAANGSVWDALSAVFAATFGDDAEIDKVGFTKEVISYVEDGWEDTRRPDGFPAFETNLAALIKELASRLRAANEIEVEQRRDKRVDRIVDAFLDDHPDGATRDTAEQTLRSIESGLEDGLEDQAIRVLLVELRRDFKLTRDPLQTVPGFDAYRDRLSAFKYAARLAHRAEHQHL